MENWLCLKKPSKKLHSVLAKSSLTLLAGSHARYDSEFLCVRHRWTMASIATSSLHLASCSL
jgi:hypothetical protein